MCGLPKNLNLRTYGPGNNYSEILVEKRARTFTNFDGGTENFRYVGVLVSRICS